MEAISLRSHAIFCLVNKPWTVSTESATNVSSRGSSPSDREIKQLNSLYRRTFGPVSIYQTLLLGFTIYLKTVRVSNCTFFDLCNRQSGQKVLNYWLQVKMLLCCHQEQEFKCKKNLIIIVWVYNACQHQCRHFIILLVSAAKHFVELTAYYFFKTFARVCVLDLC